MEWIAWSAALLRTAVRLTARLHGMVCTELHGRSGVVRLGRRMVAGIQEFESTFRNSSRIQGWRAPAEGPCDFAGNKLRPRLQGAPDNGEMMTAEGRVNDRRQHWADTWAKGRANDRAEHRWRRGKEDESHGGRNGRVIGG